MKRMKKVFAMLLAFAMVMGMSLTTFAATVSPYNATITVNGLASGDETTVNVYKLITLDAQEDDWVVADWAKSYVTVNDDGSFSLNDSMTFKALQDAATGANETPVATTKTNATTASFELPVGAYVILAAGEKATYNIMVAETYVEDATYMTSENVIVDAKTSNYKVTKATNDNFVYRGQTTVQFTITTTYPSFLDADAVDNKYEIIDTHTGMEITTVDRITIGSDPVTAKSAGYVDGNYVIDLSNTIGDANVNAGKVVTVVYTAKITSEDGYTNVAGAYRNNVLLGKDNKAGYSADLEIKKTSTDDEVLIGAEFNIKDGDSTLYFVKKGQETLYVKDSEGNDTETVDKVIDVYKLAMAANEAGATVKLESTTGYIRVEGLDEGTYTIVETKAPSGYSINDNIAPVVIEADDEFVVATSTVVDTKLNALPETGGMGTAVFTIGGCAIMIAAAYFFFVSRKKES